MPRGPMAATSARSTPLCDFERRSRERECIARARAWDSQVSAVRELLEAEAPPRRPKEPALQVAFEYVNTWMENEWNNA